MPLFKTVVNAITGPPPPPRLRPERNTGRSTASGQRVTPESARTIATAYRCENILSDDVAKMPLQTFVSRKPGEIKRMAQDALVQNIAWRLEVQPNRWMSPFVFKKTVMKWLIFWGNAYLWQPVGGNRELFILSADITQPVFDTQGNLFFATRFPNGQQELIPAVEVLHLKINSEDGFVGRSVLTFARETLGRQQGAYEAENKLYAQGFNAAGIAWLNGESTKEIRDKTREAYTEAVSGSAGMARIAVFDNKITKFDQISMKATDMQFLEGMQATDGEIANFFGMPLHKINLGKQSYESNEQQQLDYLSTTLDPYLVQWEEGAKLRWLSSLEQGTTYFRFERSALFRTNAESRGNYLNAAIINGRLSPNEARQIEDRPAFAGGDRIYFPLNMDSIGSTGGGETASQPPLAASMRGLVDVALQWFSRNNKEHE